VIILVFFSELQFTAKTGNVKNVEIFEIYGRERRKRVGRYLISNHAKGASGLR
jgi:hypothetical protein